MLKGRAFTLALSGGGAKCAAQAGVLAVLEENGLRVAGLSGVSGGGLVAVLYALGYRPADIRDFIASTHLLTVWQFERDGWGLLGTGKVRAHLQTVVGDKSFSDLTLPVSVVAANLYSGEEVLLQSGRLDDALLATMAIPALIPPLVWDGQYLVDGGLLDPLPVEAARRLGSPVLAVDVLGNGPASTPDQVFEARGPLKYAARAGRRLGLTKTLQVVHQAALISGRRLRDARLATHPPDVLIRPDVCGVGLFAFDLAGYAYEQGVAAGQAAVDEIAAVGRSMNSIAASRAARRG